MASKSPTLGVRHPTVVPTNFDPSGGDSETDDDGDSDR